MSRNTYLRLACAAFLIVGPLPRVAAQPIQISIPGTPPTVVKLEVDRAAKPWHEFLEAMVDYFDRDRNGSLDRAEVGRMFPLPLSRGKLAWDFVDLDADKNGVASLAEVKAYCESRGFTPVVAAFVSRSADDDRLAPLFVGDLARFDLNDDERIERREMLAVAPAVVERKEPGIGRADKTAAADVVLGLTLRTPIGFRLEIPLIAKDLALEADPPRLRTDRWSIALDPSPRGFDGKRVRAFLLAQFHTARGERDALPRADVDDDPELLGLRAMFAFADRDGDNRLTTAELQNYLTLVEQGAASQVWATIVDHGRNPFPLLDTDGDGVLDVRERRLAKTLPSGATFGRIMLTPPASQVWGGILVPVASPRPASVAKEDAPDWFQAMDRNGDGWISPREFLGPPSLFRSLDTDRDELISVQEAKKPRP